jgi:hypothetical protein
MINRAITFGATNPQTDAMPRSMKNPITARSAPAVSHEAAAENPIDRVPAALPASQKSERDRCRLWKYQPIRMRTAT